MTLPSFLRISPFSLSPQYPLFFFFNDPATTEIYTLSLHDALPISFSPDGKLILTASNDKTARLWKTEVTQSDRKSTRLNSSHVRISYAVFCLIKKKKKK